MKKLLFIILSVTLCLNVSAQQLKQLMILHTNDTHSHIEPISPNYADKEQADKGGYVRRATFIDAMRAKDKDLLLFDCGDFSQGTPYYNMFKGEVEISLMNKIGYNAGTIGNHEFDFGLDNMARLFKMAKFPIVCSNYNVKGTVLENLVKTYTVFKKKGLKVGVFGLSPKLEGLVQTEKCKGIVYEDPYEKANEVALLLKEKEHCDVVICLSHLGWKGSANNPVCDEELAAKTRNIDLILGGHSHSFIEGLVYYKNLDGKNVPVTQAGKNGIYVGKIDLNFEKKHK
jgi:5''-nucleotidase/2'',3''-cyclic phosphodiesterase and related esterases